MRKSEKLNLCTYSSLFNSRNMFDNVMVDVCTCAEEKCLSFHDLQSNLFGTLLMVKTYKKNCTFVEQYFTRKEFLYSSNIKFRCRLTRTNGCFIIGNVPNISTHKHLHSVIKNKTTFNEKDKMSYKNTVKNTIQIYNSNLLKFQVFPHMFMRI